MIGCSSPGCTLPYRLWTSSAVRMGRIGRLRTLDDTGVTGLGSGSVCLAFDTGAGAGAATVGLSKRPAGSRVLRSSPALRPNRRRLNSLGFVAAASDRCRAFCWRSASSGVSTGRLRLSIALSPQLTRTNAQTERDRRESVTFGKLRNAEAFREAIDEGGNPR